MGPNDLVKLKNFSFVYNQAEEIFRICQNISDTTYYFSGNAGAIPIWPTPVRCFFQKRTKDYISILQPLLHKYKVKHIDVFQPFNRDIYLKHYKEWYFMDKFHPNEKLYYEWYKEIKKEVTKSVGTAS